MDQSPGTLLVLEGCFLDVSLGVTVSNMVLICLNVMDQARASYHRVWRVSDLVQAPETFSLVPGVDQRVARTVVAAVARLSSFDSVKVKGVIVRPLLCCPEDDVSLPTGVVADGCPAAGSR